MHLISSGNGQRHLHDGSMANGVITLFKNFYFKQDAPGETAEDLVTCPDFPQYGDPYDSLSSSFGYRLKCQSVEISKLVTEEQDQLSGNYFTWICKATFSNATTSIPAKSVNPATGQPLSDDDNRTLPRKSSKSQQKKWDGTPVTDQAVAPWEIQSDISFTHFDIDTTFTKGYEEDSGLSAVTPIMNTAGDYFPVETTLQGVEITWDLDRPIGSYLTFPAAEGVINIDDFSLFGFNFKKGTLLCLPWTFDKKWTYIRTSSGRMYIKTAYITKHLCIRFNPLGWKLDLLNVGTRAKMPTYGWDFYNDMWEHEEDESIILDPMPTQLYLITYGFSIGVDASNTHRIQKGRLYGNAKILDQAYQWAQDLNDAGITLTSGHMPGGYWANGEIVTEPLPLASNGTIKESAEHGDFSDVDTLHFNRYPYWDFTQLDLWGAY